MQQFVRSISRWPALLVAVCLLIWADVGRASAAQPQRPPAAQTHEPTKKVVRHAKVVKRRVVHRKVTAKAAPQRRPVAARARVTRRPVAAARRATIARASGARVVRVVDRPLASVSSTAQNDDPVFLRSGSALVVDEDTNRVLLSKNADTARPIASLTKLMTAMVLLDAHLPMDQVIEITDADIDTLKNSASRLRPGVRLSREELLKLALMSSENRAAHALARTYPGGLTAFIAAMNRKASELGMSSTRYVEPTGLSPQNESTAHDLALLVKAAYHYPLIREFSTHPESEVDVGRRTLQYRNTDHLVFNRSWEILLQKTGYINEAGHCLVLQTLFEGRRVIVVLLDAWGRYSHFGDAERIRSWIEARGFNALRDAAPLHPREEARRSSRARLMHTASIENPRSGE